MKKSKHNDSSVNLFHIASVLLYLAAILNFIFGDNNSTGFMWLCLGSAFLCIGSAFKMKSQEDNDDRSNVGIGNDDKNKYYDNQ